MTEYLTEQEQIELLKNWFKQYTPVILTGLVIAAIVIFGWRYWQDKQNKTLTNASMIYDQMLMLGTQNKIDDMLKAANSLHRNYAKTPYGQMAVLLLAKSAISNLKYQQAEKYLNWMVENSTTNAIRQLAKIRLARVFLADKKPNETISILNDVDDDSFIGLINEIRGDAFLALNQPENARKAYKKALDVLPNAEAERPLLQMKYDNLNN